MALIDSMGDTPETYTKWRLWIDGQYFRGSGNILIELGLGTMQRKAKRFQDFLVIAREGGIFEGRHLSIEKPLQLARKTIKTERGTGPLIPFPITHGVNIRG